MVTVNVVSPDTQQRAAPPAEPVTVAVSPPATPSTPAPTDTAPSAESVTDSEAENAAVISGSFDEPEAEAMLRDLGQDPGPAESADAPDAAAVLFSESPDATDSEPEPVAPVPVTASEPEPEPEPEPDASDGSDDADAAAMMHDLGNDMPPESDPVPESAIQDPTPDTGFGEEANAANDSDNNAVSEMMDAENATHGSLSAFEDANKEEDVDLDGGDVVPEGMEDAPSVMDLINKVRQPKQDQEQPPPQEAQMPPEESGGEDGDEDGDGIPDMIDPSSNPDIDHNQTDTDGDGIPDAQDPNPMVPTSAQDAQSGPQRGPIDLSDVPRAESGKTGLLDGIMGAGAGSAGARTAESRALARGAVDQGGGRFGNFVQHGANRQKRGRGRRELSASRR